MSIVCESFSHSCKTCIWRRHVDTCYLNDISWGALSCDWASSNYFDSSWNMTDWNLIRWLLDFNILIAHKFTLLNLKDKVSLDHILHTLLTWALNFWGELLSVNALIDLKSTSITGIDCDLHARLDITASGDNTLY